MSCKVIVTCRYHEEPRPEFVGPMEINNHLKRGRRILENEIVGPEGFATDADGETGTAVLILTVFYMSIVQVGNIYTGLADGRIIRLNKDFNSYVTIARTGKPPFHSCGKVLTNTNWNGS